MNIYVGNLPFKITEEEVKQKFEQYGEVTSAKLIVDRETGKAKGFGFVEMSNDEDANKAISALDGFEIVAEGDDKQQGRPMKVNQARPKQDKR